MMLQPRDTMPAGRYQSARGFTPFIDVPHPILRPPSTEPMLVHRKTMEAAARIRRQLG